MGAHGFVPEPPKHMFTCSLLFATICSSRWIPDTSAEPSLLPGRLLQAQSVEQGSTYQLRRSSPLRRHGRPDSSGARRVALPPSRSPTQPALAGQHRLRLRAHLGKDPGQPGKGQAVDSFAGKAASSTRSYRHRCLRVPGQEQTPPPAPCKRCARLSGDADSLPGADEYKCEQHEQGPARRQTAARQGKPVSPR